MSKKSYSRVADTQLNIRTDFFTIHAFRSFCNRTQLTQNEALKLLLQSAGQNVYEKFDPIQGRLQQQEEMIAELTKSNEEIKRDYAEKHRWSLKKSDEWFTVIDQLLTLIMDEPGCIDSGHEPLKIQSFKDAKRYLNFGAYKYPDSAGSCVITIDYLAFSKGVHSAIFVCGKTEDGALVKLRWYPRKRFLGYSPRAKAFIYKGARWIFGFFESRDQAMNLVAGIPLESIHYKPMPKYENAYEMIQKEGLDAIIARAEHAKCEMDRYDSDDDYS